MAALAAASAQALAGDPRAAAETLLGALEDRHAGALEVLINLSADSRWSWPMIEDYERTGSYVLIQGRFGRFWLCPTTSQRMLRPAAPELVIRGVRLLADGLVAALAEDVA
jgi:hypothetical protein